MPTLDPTQWNDLLDHLTISEGRKNKPYTDTVGKLTIGVGWNLSDRGIPDNVIDLLLDISAKEASEIAHRLFPELNNYSPNRQKALIEMIFNLGESRFKKFILLIANVRKGDWVAASDAALNSKWASQVGQRAIRIANALKIG